MKQLTLIREQLRAVVAARQQSQSLFLPSERDEAVQMLNTMSGDVLSGGGAERLLEIVERAMNNGIE